MESVFNYRIFDVVFIHIDRCQEAGGDIFQAIIQCGICFWLLTIAQFNGNFCGSICQQCNRFIHRHSLRTGSNTFNTCEIRILAGNWKIDRIHVEAEYAVLTYRDAKRIDTLARRHKGRVRVVDAKKAYIPLGDDPLTTPGIVGVLKELLAAKR